MDVRKAWDEMGEEVAKSAPKFTRCRFHDLRHTCASDFVVAGKSLGAAGAVKAVARPLHDSASFAPSFHSCHNAVFKRERVTT